MNREEAINTLHELWRETHDPWYEETYEMAIEALQAEPVKHGTWTITYTDDGEGGEIPHLICSECKREPLAWNSKRFFKYCPKCGARMKGADDED